MTTDAHPPISPTTPRPDGAAAPRSVDTGSEQMQAFVESGIGWIVYDNPGKHNAMTADMLAAVNRIVDHYIADDEVRVVVLRGAGEKAFISGADIQQLDTGEIRKPPPPSGTMAEQMNPNAGTTGLLRLEKPVIAMIHGYCFGGGVMVALAADIRICADDAQFAIPAARLGVGYPYDTTAQLVALVGTGHAAEILFGARRIDAAEAARINLVNRVVPKAELEAEVRSLAAAIAANAPLSHTAHKQSIRAAGVGGRPADLSAIETAIHAAWSSSDFDEGRRAFLERRTPLFRGL
jgi:enoyl-CoA hydratase